MKFAIDVMSGERQPAELIRGAVGAAREFELELILVGDRATIERGLRDSKISDTDRIEIEHSDDVITMHESPAVACRQKKNASVMTAARLVKEERAAGFFSPGNTGATLGAAVMHIKRLHRIKRPVLATIFPTIDDSQILIGDLGANIECTPVMLYQFAVLMHAFAENILGSTSPRIGLMNVGEEENKGTPAHLKAFQMLKESSLNFYGNVEGRDVFTSRVDVIVCDGFSGNILLKTAEGTLKTMGRFLKQAARKSLRNMIGGWLFKPAFDDMKARFDQDKVGGAALMGLAGVVMVGHGASNGEAVKNALRIGKEMIRCELNTQIEEML